MTTAQLAVLAIFEVIGVLMILRVWVRKPRLSLWRRCFWSVVLLIPVLGLLLYGFVAAWPEGHSDELPDDLDLDHGD